MIMQNTMNRTMRFVQLPNIPHIVLSTKIDRPLPRLCESHSNHMFVKAMIAILTADGSRLDTSVIWPTR